MMVNARCRIPAGVLLAWLVSLTSAKAEKPTGSLQVGTESGKVVSLADKAWSKLPRHKVTVKGKDEKSVVYAGVSLVEVLKFAGLSFEKHPRGRSALYLLVEGADDYRAVLALAEVDPKLADKVVLLADRVDGKPLAQQAGPYRLIVPSDKLPSRWVKQVRRISVERPAYAGKK
jgi:DMSO/TMAO reductase YedYZ molybdopterin-dependent catalytic subunit